MFLHKIPFADLSLRQITAFKNVALSPILLDKVHIGVSLNQLPVAAAPPLICPLVGAHRFEVVRHVAAFSDQLYYSPNGEQVAERQIKQTEQIECIIV